MPKRPASRAVVRAAYSLPFLIATMVALPDSGNAAIVLDPTHDFVPRFLGPPNPDLDVVSASVTLTPTDFILHAVLNGPVGTTLGGFYVWGFDRGPHTQGFPVIAPGVLFDTVVAVRSDGTTNAVGGSVIINGNEITGIVPRTSARVLPVAGGVVQNQFTWNLWPRSPAVVGNPADSNVSDFAPDNSNAAVTVPEPMSLATFGTALFAGVWKRRRRRKG